MTSLHEFKESDEGLSYQEKSIIISLLGSFIVYVLFGLLAIWRIRGGDLGSHNIFQFWGRAVLLLIGVQIVLAIIGQIILHVIHAIAAREDEIPTFEDERDKLIELKATRTTFAVFGVGFILSMIVLAVGGPLVSVPVLMLAGMMAADMMGNIAKLYFYRRGY